MAGFINYVSTEKMIRRLRGLEIAFEHCRSVEDWRRGKGTNAQWVPKTQWKACDAVDATSVDPENFRVEAMEKELQEEREREALTLKAQAKLNELTKKGPDPRDAT